ncbi:hypothetical protein ACIPX0_39695 [Streptomyces sp. NPDC090075]|uniref:hypothetical protein n=1 Tax=unclassified Streptomyces TaxID=2593676 RepID=UPI0037FF2DEE
MRHAYTALAATAKGAPAASLGHRVTAPVFYNDLRLISLLLCGAWPAPLHMLTVGPVHHDALDRHAAAQNRPLSERPLMQDSHVNRAQDHPPAEPAAAAALAVLALDALKHPDAADVIAQLAAVPATYWVGWARLPALLPHCSPALIRAVEGAARTRRATYGASALLSSFAQPATHVGLLDPARIPQHLPDYWTGPLADLDVPDHHALRRDAAVRLLQMATPTTPTTPTPTKAHWPQ